MKYQHKKGFITFAIVLLIVLGTGVIWEAYSLYQKNQQQTQPITQIQDQKTVSPGIDIPVLGYITSNQVDSFHIGEPIPDQTLLSQAKYSIKEIIVSREGNPQKQFVVSRDGKDLLTFELSPDLSKIWDITVISSEFKTKESIGVGSTISDFLKAYPNYKFWYSEEEGEKFVLNTSSNNSSPQFFLDRSDLIYPNKSFYPIKATISDFSNNAKISSVRIYYTPY